MKQHPVLEQYQKYYSDSMHLISLYRALSDKLLRHLGLNGEELEAIERSNFPGFRLQPEQTGGHGYLIKPVTKSLLGSRNWENYLEIWPYPLPVRPSWVTPDQVQANVNLPPLSVITRVFNELERLEKEVKP